MTYREEPNTETTIGWPKDVGPLETLARIGILPLHADRPRWLNYQKVVTRQNGPVVYKCTAKRLDRNALRAFAALTFEHWNVYVTSPNAAAEFDIRITAAPAPTTTNTTTKD